MALKLSALQLPFSSSDADDTRDLKAVYIPAQTLKTVFVPLAKMVPAIDPPNALRAVTDAVEDPKLRLVLEAVTTRMDRGASLADAMAEFPRVFSQSILSAVDVGADAGRLKDGLLQVVEMLDREVRMQRQLRKAATYPVVALGLTVVTLAIMLKKLFPQLAQFYEKIPADKLPTLTRVLLAMSKAYDANTAFYTLLFLGGAGALVMWLRSYDGRTTIIKVMMLIPPVRRLAEHMAMERYLSHVARLQKAGRSSVDAAEAAIDTITIPELYERYEQLWQRLTLGATLSEVYADSGLFTPIVLTYVRAGEVAGGLPDMLATAADHEGQEAETRLAQIVEFMPAILTVVVGAIIGVLLLGAWGGIFALSRAPLAG